MPIPSIDLSPDFLDSKETSVFRKLAEKSVAAAIDVAELEFHEMAELSILLANDAELRALNRQWRGIDKPTNVLSFPGADIAPGEPGGLMLGDIAVSLETVKREAELENKTLNDHFCHLVIHGFLHLFGYDHETEEEAQVMEVLETKALARLAIADPYEYTADQ